MKKSLPMVPKRIKTGPGQESVWDYPRPPGIEDVSKNISVISNGLVIAKTNRAKRVLETAGAPVYYIPPDDIEMKYLKTEDKKSTFCEWKGWAIYYTISVGNRIVKNAAWSYPKPTPKYSEIKDYIAFYAGKMDACYVDEEKARPQPGGYYGGWVTNNIVGPIKGEPGSESC